MPVDLWIMIIFSVLIAIILFLFLDWKRSAPVYVLFMVIAGLLNTWVATTLVVKGYLEYPHRLFSSWTLTNVLFDLFLFPGFGLILIYLAAKRGGFILYWAIFTVWILVQDYIAIQYTDLLRFYQWTLWHTGISSAITFIVWWFLFHWLDSIILKKSYYPRSGK